MVLRLFKFFNPNKSPSEGQKDNSIGGTNTIHPLYLLAVIGGTIWDIGT